MFRNFLGALTPSTPVRVLIQFGSSPVSPPLVLTVSLYKAEQELHCQLVSVVSWRQGELLLDLQQCGLQLDLGRWTLQGKICLITF